MPSPRPFGFRPAKKRTEPRTEPADPLEGLAETVLEPDPNLPASAAWGLSPAESYLKIRRRPHRD